MKREIRFRAWNGSNMVDLKQITQFAILPDLKIDGFFIPFCKEYIIMQFTGLHDKNGKEIYEGDILQQDLKRGNKYKVFAVQGGFAINQFQSDLLKNTDEISIYESLADMQNASYTKGSTVVIGNIYENPDLCNH